MGVPHKNGSGFSLQVLEPEVDPALWAFHFNPSRSAPKYTANKNGFSDLEKPLFVL
jgi:hypothetical protein